MKNSPKSQHLEMTKAVGVDRGIWRRGVVARGIVSLLFGGLLSVAIASTGHAQSPPATSSQALRATILYGGAADRSSSGYLRFAAETERQRLAFNDPNQDPWLGFDKVQHVTFCFLWTLSSQYAFVNKFGLSEGRALPLSMASGATIGLSKEVYDRRYGSGLFSVRDLVADAVGLVLAAGVILL